MTHGFGPIVQRLKIPQARFFFSSTESAPSPIRISFFGTGFRIAFSVDRPTDVINQSIKNYIFGGVAQ